MTIEITEQKFGLYGYLDMHKAVRRHLNNYIEKASRTSPDNLKMVKILQDDFNYYWHLLEFHHKTEDVGLFPMLGGIDSIFAGEIEEMTEDHAVVDELAAEIKGALEAAVAGREAAYNQFVSTTRHFREVLFDHLRREEIIVIAAMNRHFSHEQQIAMEEQIIGNMPLEHLSSMFPWMFEIMTAEEREVAYSQLPASLKSLYGEWEEAYYRRYALR